MYRLVISEFAHRDLDNIVSYIAVQLANPIAATNFLDVHLSLFLRRTGLCETDIKFGEYSMYSEILHYGFTFQQSINRIQLFQKRAFA